MGMTTAEVKASWGKPDDINRSVGSWGVHEQWIYYKISTFGLSYTTQYLYFENNILTGWQD